MIKFRFSLYLNIVLAISPLIKAYVPNTISDATVSPSANPIANGTIEIGTAKAMKMPPQCGFVTTAIVRRGLAEFCDPDFTSSYLKLAE